jgi:hypothetical protein
MGGRPRGLRTRYPEATVVQGDAYSLKRLLGGLLREPAAAVVSGLPLPCSAISTMTVFQILVDIAYI